MKVRKIAVILFLLALLVPSLALASGSETNVYFSKDQSVADNHYATGASVEVAGKVGGDLFIIGGSVVVTGEVAGDVLVLGGNIRIAGTVGGNVRIVGGNVEITGPVNKNVSVVAGTLNIASTSNISGTTSVVCGMVDIRGAIAGTLDGYAGGVIVAGTLKNGANLVLGPKNSVNFRDTAIVQGEFTYKATKPAAVAVGAKISEPLNYVAYTEFKKSHYSVDWALKQLIIIFSLLVVALVVTSLFSKFLEQITMSAQVKPWRQMGWGFVWLVVPPIVFILLMITLIGLPLALILLGVYIIGLYLIPIFAGSTLITYLKTIPSLSFINRWPLLLSVCIGIIIFKLLTLIPYLGWLISLISLLWLWGAMVNSLKQILSNR